MKAVIKTQAHNVTINGISLHNMIRHYNAISILLGEVGRLHGDFSEWDKAREGEGYSETIPTTIEVVVVEEK